VTLAVVGPGSLVARALGARPEAPGWRFVRWQDAISGDAWLDGVDAIVVCAYHPALRGGAPYDPALDVDLAVARLAARRRGVRYLMLGSRAVYGPAGDDPVLREDRPPRPDRPYGASKLATERALAALLGDRLTVLRLSNVFGDEAVPGRRTFFGVALASLRERGAIVLDVDPSVTRDFVPVESVAAAIARVAEAPRAGTFNVGAGVSVPVGDVARWLVEGYGAGRVEVTDRRRHDAFAFDVGAAVRAFGIAPSSPEQVRARCIAVGRRMRGGD
jgi:nucleoside-diphosphate-sugar epimerase